MGRVIGVVLLAMFLAGCATARPSKTQSLENRVQALEARMGALEASPSSSELQVSMPVSESMTSRSSSTVEGMTKRDVQQALKNAGYYTGNIDGKFGPKTKAAIKEFQSNMGLKVDGVAGRNTKEKLLKYLP